MNSANAAPGHPAPHAGRVSITRLLLLLTGAPVAWAVQIAAGYGAAAYACYPHRDALAAPVLPHLHGLLIALSVAAIALAALCALLSYRSWRLTRNEVKGDHHQLLDVGEGRTRFMALCALISSVGFGLALLVTTSVLVLVPPCGL
ncbi:MAG TPA: hypothetical protein VFS02_23600 [Telluria sp.]|nr:hypothetical protein [Telluria sp.]